MRLVPVTEIGLMEIPESSRIFRSDNVSRTSISLWVSGLPCSNSMPA